MERFDVPMDKETKYWEKYSEPSGDIRNDTLYLYGVDYLNTRKILEYFKYFSPVKVEWLNDTSCNVVFPASDNALQALNTNCMDKIEDISNFENIKRPAMGYQFKDEMIPLYFRFATTGVIHIQDIKDEEVTAEKSKYYKWVKQKNRGIRHKPISRKAKPTKSTPENSD